MTHPEGFQAPPPAPVRAARAGIGAIRYGLGLGEAEEALIHGAARVLANYVPQWVDGFYARLMTNPAAVRILDDDARVIRLKRSLTSWFHELLTLAWDEDFERRREAIGDSHVRVHMPNYLMITAMSGLRRDVTATILRVWDAEPEEAQEIAAAMSLALDMELTLILLAFRRRERVLARQKDRMVYAQRAARRMTHTLYDRVDAALCYAELARRDDARRLEHLAKLKDMLRGLARFDQRRKVQAQITHMDPKRVAIAAMCGGALADVSMDPSTRVELNIIPPGLEAVLVAPAVQQAIEELAQNAAIHAAGGTIRVSCHASELGDIIFEVTDQGPGWGPEVKTFQDIYSLGSGLGLSFCELVAELHEGTIELFEAPGGGAGIRLELHTTMSEEEAS